MHRVGQFVAHVRARVAPYEEAFAHRVLPPRAASAFDEMPVADRRHGLDVTARLLAEGHDSPDVLAAALLHDVAKGSRMRLWHRVAGVLLETIAPRLLGRLADPRPASWRHGLYLYLHHARMSAEVAEAVGCSPSTVRLLRGEADGDREARLLRALRAADDAS